MGCSWGARFHAKERRYFCVLFRERFRCDGNLKRDRSTFRAKVAKTAMAWPKLGFGWYWPLRTSAAGLEGPRGIFRRQDAPKKPFKYTLEWRYSARVSGRKIARAARARRHNTLQPQRRKPALGAQPGRAQPRQGAPGYLRTFSRTFRARW